VREATETDRALNRRVTFQITIGPGGEAATR
jgi:hypothetical protein